MNLIFFKKIGKNGKKIGSKGEKKEEANIRGSLSLSLCFSQVILDLHWTGYLFGGAI